MHDTGFFHPEIDLAGFELLNRFGHIEGDGPGFGVGHQPARPQQPTDLADRSHHVRRGHGFVKTEPAALESARSDRRCPRNRRRPPGFGFLFALGKHQHLDLLAQAMWQHDRTAHHLIGMPGIDPQPDGDVNGFIEFGKGCLDGRFNGFRKIIPFAYRSCFWILSIFYPVSAFSVPTP
jgi:hypothetical protein